VHFVRKDYSLIISSDTQGLVQQILIEKGLFGITVTNTELYRENRLKPENKQIYYSIKSVETFASR